MAAPIERKAGAATLATFAATQIVWAVFTFWPAANDAISTDDQLQLTAILATVLTAAAGYYAAHTHRPDLVTVTQPAEPAAEPAVEPAPAVTGLPAAEAPPHMGRI